MKKIILLLFLMQLSVALLAQDVYQASVIKGFSLQGMAGAQMWKSELLSPKSASGIVYGIGAMYGVNEHLFGYFKFQSSLQRTLVSKEIEFMIYSKQISNSNVSAGLGYAFGKPDSRLKYFLRAGYTRLTTPTKLFDDGNDIEYKVSFKGGGIEAGLGAFYYFQPYLSASFGIDGAIGNYNQSEFLGRTYKEKIKWNILGISLGLNYHFNGR